MEVNQINGVQNESEELFSDTRRKETAAVNSDLISIVPFAALKWIFFLHIFFTNRSFAM